jgi:outer membrane PBP1 activator LpoA protein
VFKKLPVFIIFLVLFGCSLLTSEPEPGIPTIYYTESVSDYLQKASMTQNPSEIAYYRIQAAGRALSDGQTEEAKSYLALTDGVTLAPRQQEEKSILKAKIAANEGNNLGVLNNLATINQPAKLPPELARSYYQLASLAHQGLGQNEAYCQDLIRLSTLLPSDQAMAVRHATLLCLEALPAETLQRMADQSDSSEDRGWIVIAQLNKDTSNGGQNFQNNYQQWLQQYPNHPASILFPISASGTVATGPARATTTANVDSSRIALLLPTTGSAGSAGKAVRDGFMAAYYSHPTGHSVKLYDTNGADTAAVYNRAVADGATLVVGPLTKSEVSRLADAGTSVSTLVLNNIPTQRAKRNFYQFALSPNDEAEQAALRAYARGYTRALVIAPADSWGQGVVNSFVTQFTRLGGQIPESVAYTNSTPLDSAIKNALQAKSPNAQNSDKSVADRRQDIDVIFLVATPDKARAIKPLLNFYYANNIPVYATNNIYNGVRDPFKDQDLNGIQFSTLPWYVSNSSEVAVAKANTATLTTSTMGLYAFGYDAYNMAINFNQLANGYSGVTGILYLRPNQQVYREGVWAQFQNGEARLI